MGCGVTRMSSRDFCRELQFLRASDEADVEVKPVDRNTVAGRIPPDVLKKLEALRDA